MMVFCFLMGIGNFAMHRAVAESGHPFIEDTKLYFGPYFGRNTSYALEFAVLLAAMLLAQAGSLLVFLAYFAYTALNILATWLLLSGRV